MASRDSGILHIWLLCRGHTTVGVKRGLAAVADTEIEPAHLQCEDWASLAGDPSGGSAFVPMPLPRVCVCGISELGSQLAECLASKAGTAVLGLHDSDDSLLLKYSLLPVSRLHSFMNHAQSSFINLASAFYSARPRDANHMSCSLTRRLPTPTAAYKGTMIHHHLNSGA
jgi:hypothetical protein